MFYTILCPNTVWFWKLGYSRFNLKGFVIQWKLANEISLNFLELFITVKYVKIRFKSRGPPSCSSPSSLHFWFHFYDVCRAKTDAHNKYILNFVFGSFFEQDHLFNWSILGVYAKRLPKCARISKQKQRTIP